MRISRLIGLLGCGTAFAQSADSFSDSLSTISSDSLLALDTARTAADSLHLHRSLTDSWLLPLGIIAASVAGIWLLFTVRSR
jgi:hypothetical protein